MTYFYITTFQDNLLSTVNVHDDLFALQIVSTMIYFLNGQREDYLFSVHSNVMIIYLLYNQCPQWSTFWTEKKADYLLFMQQQSFFFVCLISAGCCQVSWLVLSPTSDLLLLRTQLRSKTCDLLHYIITPFLFKFLFKKISPENPTFTVTDLLHSHYSTK